MTEDQAAPAGDSTPEAPQAATTDAGATASQPGNVRTEREWRGDWQIAVGMLVIIGVLALVLWLLHRGR